MGSGGVGKSSITLQLVQNIFTEKYDPTIEDSYRKTLYEPSNPNEPYNLEILDTAGSEQFASMRDLYIRNGDGFLLVYSQTSPGTLKELGSIYSQIQKIKGHAPMVIVANKQDLGNGENGLESAKTLANKWSCPVVETSAKDRKSVEKAFLTLVREIEKKEQSTSSNNTSSAHNNHSSANGNDAKKKKKKCIVM